MLRGHIHRYDRHGQNVHHHSNPKIQTSQVLKQYLYIYAANIMNEAEHDFYSRCHYEPITKSQTNESDLQIYIAITSLKFKA